MREISQPTYGEYTDEEARRINALEDEADAEAGQRRSSLRWNRTQFDLIRKAAEAMGMPYQTYVKQAAFRQALEDLQRIANLQQSTTRS